MGAIQIPVVHRSGHDNGYVLDAFRFKDRMVLPARSLLTGKGALSYYAFVAPGPTAVARRRSSSRRRATAPLARVGDGDARVRGDAGIVATAALCGEVALAMVEAAAAAASRRASRRPPARSAARSSRRLEQSETMSLAVAKEA
ncbi:oxidoreductase [Aureococcus anophagefferens]|uniref:Oxidoreductase n=1 Tax=Aureococcus anophagefferens TaxID=44056 RepID=A0ABR1GEV3_AURAN